MSTEDRKTLSSEILPAPEGPPAGTPRERVTKRLRRILKGAIVGGVVVSVTSLGCDPAPSPSRDAAPDTGQSDGGAPDGTSND